MHRLPTNVNFCFEGIEGEAFCCCWTKGHLRQFRQRLHHPARWTPAMCCWPSAGPMRWPTAPCGLSLCDDTTEAHVDYILEKVPGIVAYLRDMSPMWKDLKSGKRTHS